MTTALRICLLSALGGVLVAPIGLRLLRRRFDPFEPIVLFGIAYGVMFVVRPAAMIATHHLAYNGPRTSTDVSATFTKMLVLALIGAVAFVAAYEAPLGGRLASGWRGLGDLAAPASLSVHSRSASRRRLVRRVSRLLLRPLEPVADLPRPDNRAFPQPRRDDVLPLVLVLPARSSDAPPRCGGARAPAQGAPDRRTRSRRPLPAQDGAAGFPDRDSSPRRRRARLRLPQARQEAVGRRPGCIRADRSRGFGVPLGPARPQALAARASHRRSSGPRVRTG